MRIFWFLWKKLAELRFIWRVLIKLVIFGAVSWVVCYPNPVLFFKQLYRYFNVESLIQPNFTGIDEINREIDEMLPPEATREHEMDTVQKYVYDHIRYLYDWTNWGNIDYWPPAEQVWERKKEDCDGRAVLAVSILRSRGFTSARIVGNIRHIWVSVDRDELMGPDKEKTFRVEEGKTKVALPSFFLLWDSLVGQIAKFPPIRNLILLFTVLLLCYHPCRNLTGFFGITSLGSVGFILLREGSWTFRPNNFRSFINFDFVSGCILVCAAVILSLCMQKIVKRKT